MKKLLLLLILLTPLLGFQRHFAGFSVFINHPGYAIKYSFTKNRFIIAYQTPLKISGTLGNSIIAIDNGLIVSGKVKKNIIALNSNIRIKSTGVVEGNIISFGGKIILEKGAQAKKLNLLVLITMLKMSGGLAVFMIYLSFVILGLFLNYHFIKNFVYIGDYVKKKFFSALLAGVLVLPLAFLFLLALTGTILGTLLLPVIFFIFILYFIFAFYAVAVMLGEQLMKIFTFRDHPYFEQFLGITIFFFLCLLPYFGFPLFVLFFLTGLGAVVILRFGVR
ncbi:membrane protein [sediment metagenome]|uniref:Membrane protein n=1 Tax=sediment metagenome TaxID=749907 RepID=D9PMB5_9ZZZZ